MDIIFTPTTLGKLQLKNRMVMAPMTRSRADKDGTPTDIFIDYYAQRASAGLIISEGVYPSEDGKGYSSTPGIVSEKHIAAWKKITQAVKNKGGLIVMQIMHCGRICCAENKNSDAETVAPSAIKANAELFTGKGMVPCDTPRELREDEIPLVIEQYRQATENAFAAGFDGVELHCTSGYLPAQFLSTGTNKRTDQWGGSVDNRIRFVVEVLNAMVSVKGADYVGIRICPANPYNDLQDDNPLETFQTLLNAIAPLKLAYLHAIISPDKNIDVVKLAKENFKGPLIINEGFNKETANEILQNDNAQAVAFGKPFIANPDLKERFENNWPLADIDMQTIYTGNERGYCDYPAYKEM